jgi:hypothetical protein
VVCADCAGQQIELQDYPRQHNQGFRLVVDERSHATCGPFRFILAKLAPLLVSLPNSGGLNEILQTLNATLNESLQKIGWQTRFGKLLPRISPNG